MCRASGVGAEIFARSVPAIGRAVFELIAQGCVPGGTRQNLEAASEWVDWGGCDEARRILLSDAQTSGGLLLCIAPKRLDSALRLLREAKTASAVEIGHITRAKTPAIAIKI
jgi:selenide,water dikinase